MKLKIRNGGRSLPRGKDFDAWSPLLRRLLVLLLGIIPIMAFAGERDSGRCHSIDPTGVWLQPNVAQAILLTFHQDGTYSADVAGESAFIPNNHSPGFQLTSPTHALWQKTGAKTLAGTAFALQYNDDGTFYGLLKVRVTGVLNDSGDQMDITISGAVFDLSGNPIPNPPPFTGTGRFVRLRLEFP